MDQGNTTARVDSEDRPLDGSIRIIERFRNLQEELEATQVERDQFRERCRQLERERDELREELKQAEIDRDEWMDAFQRAVNRDIDLSALEQIGKEKRK